MRRQRALPRTPPVTRCTRAARPPAVRDTGLIIPVFTTESSCQQLSAAVSDCRQPADSRQTRAEAADDDPAARARRPRVHGRADLRPLPARRTVHRLACASRTAAPPSSAAGRCAGRVEGPSLTTSSARSGGARPRRAAGISVGRSRCCRMRATTAGSSIRAIRRKRPPPLDDARDGPEPRRRAAPRTEEHLDAETPAHQVGPQRPPARPGRTAFGRDRLARVCLGYVGAGLPDRAGLPIPHDP